MRAHVTTRCSLSLLETWLTNVHHFEEYFPGNYIVYRYDTDITLQIMVAEVAEHSSRYHQV